MNIRRFTEGSWEWIESNIAPHGHTSPQGEYLFFSSRKDLLFDIAEKEIESNNFFTAKITQHPHPGTGEYALHLHDIDDAKEKELALRHGDNQGIRYAGWKGDACTIKDFFQKLCVNKHDLAI